MKPANVKPTVKYPRFSAYFKQMLVYRKLRNADVARICDIDETVLFKWWSGNHLPKSWDSLEPVIVKLRFTPNQISGLRKVYQEELLGEEQSKCFNEIIKIFHVLEDKRTEYAEEQQTNFKKNIIEIFREQGLGKTNIRSSVGTFYSSITQLVKLRSVKIFNLVSHRES